MRHACHFIQLQNMQLESIRLAYYEIDSDEYIK